MAKYQEVIGWITEQIEGGTLHPGMKIPSENTLCQQFGISRQTARHAISELEGKGLLYSRRGSGTFISGKIKDAEKRQKRIAVVTTYVDSYIFPETLQGIESGLNRYGYLMQISFTNNDFDKERMILEDILANDDIAGLIIEPTKSTLPNPNLELFRKLMGREIPVLFINSYYPELRCHHVSLNDRECAYKAVSRLIELGHTRIGCIFKLDDGQGMERYSGYRRAMQEKGCPVDESWIVWLDTTDVRHIYDMRQRIISRLKRCSAVFCYNDQVAVNVIDFLQKEGISIPGDVSVVSMDDSELATMNGMSLSSVPHPERKLGEKAAENMIHLIHNSGFNATFEFNEELVERNSIRRI